MREEGDSRYSHSSPELMTNDECCALFGCHIVPDCFQTWAVSFMHGQLFLCMGSCSRVWAFVFMRGRPFSCVGDHLRVWATVFMRGRPSSCVAVVSVHKRFRAWAVGLMHGVVVGVGGVVVVHGVIVSSCVGDRLRAWRSFPCVGGHFRGWAVSLMHGWLLALVGSLLCVGSLSCGSAGTIAEGWVVLTILKNNDER